MASRENNVHQVVDFDWTLKWIFGSNTVSTHQEPLVSLHFHVKNAPSQSDQPSVSSSTISQEHLSTISTELSQGDVQMFLAALEQVKLKS